jgi:hypothetical protein
MERSRTRCGRRRGGGGDGGDRGRRRHDEPGKLTPFLAYPRSLFNCILLSNFPRGAIDRDMRSKVEGEKGGR